MNTIVTIPIKKRHQGKLITSTISVVFIKSRHEKITAHTMNIIHIRTKKIPAEKNQRYVALSNIDSIRDLLNSMQIRKTNATL
jgi:hypothetical protein